MQEFKSFLLVNYSTAKKIQDFKIESDFKISFEQDPSERFWSSIDNKTFLELADGKASKKEIIGELFPAQRIIIHSNNIDSAENIRDLFYTANNIIYPDQNEKAGPGFLMNNESEQNPSFSLDKEPFNKYFIVLKNALLAFKILLKCNNDKDLIYTLIKFNLSQKLDSFTPHSVEPRFGQVFENYDSQYFYHVNAAYAINTAYSIIEELQLEIRSSQNRPTYNKEQSDWNKGTKEDLQQRLDEINLSTNIKFIWILRGNLTFLQRDIKPNFGKRIYPEDPIILDEEIDLIEAIQRARYIRNFITAHRFRDLTQFISPYDVFNIQTLARKLFFNKIGLWEELKATASNGN